MKETEFRIPDRCDLALAGQIIEQVCERLGLRRVMKVSLAKYPGCIHWHYKKDPQSGTLDLTLHPQGGRIWAQVQASREAQWIALELPRVRREIETRLRLRTGKKA